MSTFGGDYLDDEQIWARIENLIEEKKRLSQRLAQPEVSTDPDKVAKLSRRLSRLTEIAEIAGELKKSQEDLEAAKAMVEEDEGTGRELVDEYQTRRDELGEELFDQLLQAGYLQEEAEDDRDIQILKFIQTVGPEYAIQLARSFNIEVAEARERLKVLVEKGLLTRVEGTMLESYHRQDGWDKHMNHTYYKLSHKGELYLRDLRDSNR